MKLTQLVMALLIALLSGVSNAEAVETNFFEAESMTASSKGWVTSSGAQSRRASRAKTLWGADGPGDAVATQTVTINEPGRFKVWVRAQQVAAWRGPFRVELKAEEKLLGTQTFDLEVVKGVADWQYHWQSFEVELPKGEVTLSVAKHQQKNCTGYVRHVDCFLLTNDLQLVPDHATFGPQVLVRVTIGEGYERPVYLHLFADHYRDPWYAHWALGKDGARAALAPPKDQLLKSGESTQWCNLTPTIYQDSGAALNFSVRHSYHERAARLRAKIEFGRARRRVAPQLGAESQSDSATNIEVIKTFDIDADPNGVVIIAPPDLESPEHIALLKRDRDFAEEVGKLADAFEWPTQGRKPTKIPFLATANIGGYELPVDAAVTRREQQTLDYFGFNGTSKDVLHGLWHMKDGSYCRPDLDAMRSHAKQQFEQFQKSGRRVEDIPFCMLMDEPTGQPTSFIVKDDAYRERFREWLKGKSLKPEDLLVASWDEVRPVVESEREKFPALHFFTQLFRTRALGDFMATQRKIIEETYGRSFPTLVNFSDGAVYHANFCGQGIDYFELLDADDQNAIWGEDWSNNASTYQCASFNVALMQAAARQRGQTIGHYLIAHAGRRAWDIKTKAVSETARGVRLWKNFSYGPNWGSHEGGPAAKSHLWHHRPELWRANAEVTREIGAVEDWLLTAKPAPTEVALIYSSSSDIWTMPSNLAFGFDRMHCWLALTHAGFAVDILSEQDVAAGRLSGNSPYRVCYLAGPNLTHAAAGKLSEWVKAGGVLHLTAGAAERDEFNRPLNFFGGLLKDPSYITRSELTQPEPYHASGKFLSHLKPLDTVALGSIDPQEVLSVKQHFNFNLPPEIAGSRSKSLDYSPYGSYSDRTAAGANFVSGKGRVFALGYLPGLSYIKSALSSRRALERSHEQELAKQAERAGVAPEDLDQPAATSGSLATPQDNALPLSDNDLLRRSYNPWKFSASLRHPIIAPLLTSRLSDRSLICLTPLVDAVELRCEPGVLIALSNFTLQRQEKVTLRLRTAGRIKRVASVRQGELSYQARNDGSIEFSLPLDATDFVTIEEDREASALMIGQQRFNKVLFLGNSITLHGPAPKIGWTGNWGMAASAPDKDFVHVLLKKIADETKGTPQYRIQNIAEFERQLTNFKSLDDYLRDQLAFKPDVVIVALGENAAALKTDADRDRFRTAFTNLWTTLKTHGADGKAPKLYVRSQFWADAEKDRLLKETCIAAGGVFIDVSQLGSVEANYARSERQFEHAGVAGHPGDRGMQALADAIWSAIVKPQ